MPEVAPRAVHVGFVTDKVALGQVLFVPSVFPCKYDSPLVAAGSQKYSLTLS